MIKKSIYIILMFLYVINLTDVKAITLKEYEDKVKKYQNEVNAAKNAIKKTEKEIANTKSEINNIDKEIKKSDHEIKNMKEDAEKAKVEIKEKSLQTKEYFKYLQLANGENAYLEYAFGADNVTDFIYRMSIVEQMAEYNNEVIEELEEMIERNQKREVEINKKQEQLDKDKELLNTKIISLGEEKESLEEGGVDSAKQLKIYQELVAGYKKVGCKSHHVIGVDCAVSSSGKFRRPTKTGYITSEFGSRWGSFHRGVDISSSNRKKEKIYPIANGTIIAKYYDAYGALVLIIEHYDAESKTWYSSLYCHLSKYAPDLYVGKYVTSDQYIGYMGNTGYVIPAPTKSNPDAGTHLHLEVAPCRVYKDSKCGTWNKYVSYVQQVSKNNKFKGPRQLISFPNSGTRWNTR